MEKDNLKSKLRLVSTALLLLSLVVSASLYFILNYGKSDRIFYFFDHQSGEITGENRKIPSVPGKRERNIEIFLSELMLGPFSMKLDPVFPAGTKAEKLIYRNGILYLDLNFKALKPDNKAIHGFDNGILILKKNIRFNFPFVREVVITVAGQPPLINVME